MHPEIGPLRINREVPPLWPPHAWEGGSRLHAAALGQLSKVGPERATKALNAPDPWKDESQRSPAVQGQAAARIQVR